MILGPKTFQTLRGGPPRNRLYRPQQPQVAYDPPKPLWQTSLLVTTTQNFDFTIIHKRGAHNNAPDALSRNPLPLSTEAPTDFAVKGSLDLRTLPQVLLADRFYIKQLQLEDPVTNQL